MSRNAISGELKKAGFGGLDDPNIVQQLAFCVRDHEHLRSLLSAMPPEKRNLAYQQLRPHLRFQAKPLDVYIAELQQEAERKKLPVIEPVSGELIEFDDYHTKPAALEVLAERAILATERDETKTGTLLLVCRKCTREEAFPGRNKTECWRDAKLDGWRNEVIPGRKELTSLCAACSPKNTIN